MKVTAEIKTRRRSRSTNTLPRYIFDNLKHPLMRLAWKQELNAISPRGFLQFCYSSRDLK
jgi:hypothetical protein